MNILKRYGDFECSQYMPSEEEGGDSIVVNETVKVRYPNGNISLMKRRFIMNLDGSLCKTRKEFDWLLKFLRDEEEYEYLRLASARQNNNQTQDPADWWKNK